MAEVRLLPEDGYCADCGHRVEEIATLLPEDGFRQYICTNCGLPMAAPFEPYSDRWWQYRVQEASTTEEKSAILGEWREWEEKCEKDEADEVLRRRKLQW